VGSPWKTAARTRRGTGGKFIVFEGIDGSGKTTQARLLTDTLRSRGKEVLLTAEPSDSPEGLVLRAVTSRPGPEEEARLFTEDRRHHVEHVIRPALEAGLVVVCDRYVYSSVAYQGARGIDPERIISANRPFLVPPDVILLLEVPVDQALDRIGAGRLAAASPFEVKENLEAVDAIYRCLVDPLIRRIDSTEKVNVVHDRIVRLVADVCGWT
jgi:dTMP kinase